MNPTTTNPKATEARQSDFPFETEMTDMGEQALIPGVRRVTTRDRLQLLADAPMLPRRPQKPCNIGLFDEFTRNQLWLF